MKISTALLSLALAMTACIPASIADASNRYPPPDTNCTFVNFSNPYWLPDYCYVPYASNSVYNIPISAGFTVDPNSAAYMSYYESITNPFFTTTVGSTQAWDATNDFGHPVNFSHSVDPLVSITCDANWSGNCTNVTPGMKFHIPLNARPAQASDHHLTIIDTTTGNELDLWGAGQDPSQLPNHNFLPLSSNIVINGNILTSSAGYGPITGTGLGFGQTHSQMAQWGGVIRQPELMEGHINHTIGIVAPCTNTSVVYPAENAAADTVCANGKGAPYGARFYLAISDAQIAALPDPVYVKTIYTALAHYGAYINDTNNSGSFGVDFESDQMYVSSNYTNPGCPTNGALCTPISAYMHSIGDPGWNGHTYVMNMSSSVINTYGRWLLPPVAH